MTSREPAQRESFIVRVRWKPERVIHEMWIQHVRLGETTVVHSLDQAMAFIERWTTAPAAEDRQGLR